VDQKIRWYQAQHFPAALKFSQIIANQLCEHLLKVLVNDRPSIRPNFHGMPVPLDVLEDGKAEPDKSIGPRCRR